MKKQKFNGPFSALDSFSCRNATKINQTLKKIRSDAFLLHTGPFPQHGEQGYFGSQQINLLIKQMSI